MAAHGALVVIGRQAEGPTDLWVLDKYTICPKSWVFQVGANMSSGELRSSLRRKDQIVSSWKKPGCAGLPATTIFPYVELALHHTCCCHMQNTLLAADQPRQPRLANSSTPAHVDRTGRLFPSFVCLLRIQRDGCFHRHSPALDTLLVSWIQKGPPWGCSSWRTIVNEMHAFEIGVNGLYR